MAKKSKKSKLSKLTRVFNVNTTKGKLLVFLLTFAVVGGGYMAYNTFAATSTEEYTVAEDLERSPYVFLNTETSGNKKSLKYARLNRTDVYVKGKNALIPGGLPTGFRAVRFCAWVRGIATNNHLEIVAEYIDGAPRGTFKFGQSTDYIKKCTPYYSNPYYSEGRGTSPLSRYQHAFVRLGSKGGDVRISSVVVDWY